MENIAFDIWLSNRMDFTKEERRECFETALTIVKIATEVRLSGLLSQADKITSMSDAFLQIAMQLAIDSILPDEIKKILQTQIVANNYKGKELLKRVLIKEGVVSIVNGENPRQIEEYLKLYFGDDLLQEYNDYSKTNRETKKYDFREVFKDIKPVGETNLDKMAKKMDNLAIQRLIREIDAKDFVIAFKGLSEETIMNFLKNMSKTSAEVITEDFLHLRNFKESDLTAVQERILAKIRELEERGEIIFAKSE